MLKKGDINIKLTVTTNSTVAGYERSPNEEVLMEKQTAAYKSGSGTLDNTTNNGTLILGQNVETDGVVGRKENKLYGKPSFGVTQVKTSRNTSTIKGSINSSKYSNG